jgi:hypothetical protein
MLFVINWAKTWLYALQATAGIALFFGDAFRGRTHQARKRH